MYTNIAAFIWIPHKNWSQEEMAAKLNMSVNGYSKIERGETKAYIPKLEQIAEVLEMDLLELMSFGEKYVAFLIGDSNHGCNIIGSPQELISEIEKLQLAITHKDEIIDHLKQEIAHLNEINDLLKTQK
jgi:transcriptional regulator with XRE-family HTH domain